MRQRLQQTATVSTRSYHCDVPMKGCMTTLSFVLLLVCHVGANFPCKPEQIHWNTTTGKGPKCLNCPDCPAGSQPSVPCGSSVTHWPDIHCVSCTLGKTYSDKYDKAQCRACAVCTTGKVVVKNCTLFSNSQCGSECKQGYYSVHFIFACFPCSQCCHDGTDEIATECANHEKKCKVRSSSCTNTRKTNVPTTVLVPTTSSILQTTQSGAPKDETTIPSTKEVVKNLTSPVFHGHPVEPTRPGAESVDQDESAVKAIESKKQDNGNGTIVTLAAVVALLGIAFACLLGLISVYVWRIRRNANPSDEDIDGIALQQINQVISPSQEHLNPDDVTLEQLENNNMELFDWMCTRLDNGRLGFRRDYERLASKYKRIPLEARNSLRNESLSEGRSPSKLLMSHLQTAYPNLPLRHFVKSLKDIGRIDIVQKLTLHMRESVV